MFRIYSPSEQVRGNFDFGRILERKPIGFPHEGGKTKPYSSLFYWAHAWSEEGGLIDRHPHTGFEIVSFVLNGEIEHFDSNYNGWKKLSKGDLQIIRAGNGIEHAERLLPGSAIFQIWFDPDIRKTLSEAASYDDYRSDSFQIEHKEGFSIKHLTCVGSPVVMRTEGVCMKVVDYSPGEYSFCLKEDMIGSIFITEGGFSSKNQHVSKGDFSILETSNEVEIVVTEPTQLFMVESPAQTGYKTYYESTIG